jgi:hypothetical protein
MAPGVLHRVIHGTPSPEQWQRDLLTIRPALLYSHRRHRVRGAHYPAIIPNPSQPSSCVRGTLVTGLTEGDIWRLDLFEGDQYKRDTVTVSILKDTIGLDQAAPIDEGKLDEVVESEVQAQTYLWTDPISSLDPEEWDFEEFKRENMRAWMGLTSSDDEDHGLEVDEGFRDVDDAVGALAEQEREEDRSLRSQNDDADRKGKHDPMGGRGAGGHITRRLEEAVV